MTEDEQPPVTQLEALGRLARAIDEATLESRLAREATVTNTKQLEAEKHWRKIAVRVTVGGAGMLLALFAAFAVFVLVVLGRQAALIRENKTNAHLNAVARCEDGNAFRHADEAKWEHIMSLIEPPVGAPPAQKAAAAKFIADILGLTHQQDTPADCTKVP